MIGVGGAARIRTWPNVVLTFDGNSLVSGVGSSVSALPAKVAAAAPINGVITAYNTGVSGQSTQDMINKAAPDGNYTFGKANVLLLWEGTNSISNVGRSADQALSDMQAYITARRANGRKWSIMVLTTLPRQTGPLFSAQADINTFNGILADYNAKMLANYRALGADAVCDVRQAGSPFAFSDYSTTSFAANNSLWSEAAGGRVHLTDAGYAVIAGYIAAKFPRMPLRNAS